MAHSEATLQTMIHCDQSDVIYFRWRWVINKTMALGHGVTTPICLALNLIESVNGFSYFGSTVTATFSLDDEIDTWIGKAATTCEKLGSWNNRKLTLKIRFWFITPASLELPYMGSETWTSSARNENKTLRGFHFLRSSQNNEHRVAGYSNQLWGSTAC